jgi:hypothetical protein
MQVKGHTFADPIVKDSFTRRAVFFSNKIIESLGKLGVVSEAIEVSNEVSPIKRLPATVTWFQDGHKLRYDYKQMNKYVDNLAVISKVIELEVAQVLAGHKPVHEFVGEFKIDEDVDDQRVKARELLGVDAKEMDLEIIDKKYKTMSKAAHPDMPGGNAEKFKELNTAHKVLRKELQ